MNFDFTEEECCIKCQNSLNCLNKWYYLDNYGNQRGPFDSFLILYYIYSGYFDDNSVFFLYDKSNGGPSNYNTLNNYINKIVGDVETHAHNIFPCTHFMEYFSTPSDEKTDDYEAMAPGVISNSLGSKELLISSDNIYESAISTSPSNEFANYHQTSDDNQDNHNALNNNTILKKRVANNLKEAEEHLTRVNSRRISHVLEKNLNNDSL